MWMVLLVYPPLSRRILEFFQCSENIDGAFYLVRDYSIECYNTEWFSILPIAIIVLVLYAVGIPLFILLSLWKIRKSLKDPKTSSRFGFLYNAYRPSMFLWDAWELVKTLFLTSIIILIAPGKTSQVVAGGLANLLFLIVIMYFQPHKNNVDRNLAILVDIALTLTMLIGLLLKTDTAVKDSWNKYIIDLSLIIINGSVALVSCYAIIFPICKSWYNNRQHKRNRGKHKRRHHHFDSHDENAIKNMFVSPTKVHPENNMHKEYNEGPHRRKSLATNLIEDMVREEKSHNLEMERTRSDSHMRMVKRLLKQKFMQAIRKEHGAASNEYTETMKYVAEGSECDVRKLIDSLPKEMRGQFQPLL
jgi:hypothetical protein